MRRYTVSINGTDHVVDVEEVTANTFRVNIADQAVDVRLRDHQDLGQAMITPTIEVGRQHQQASVPAGGGGGATAAPSGPAPSAPTAPSTPASGAGPARAAAAPGGSVNTLTAPMPGVVLSISARAGQQVSRGDALLVLEAMKMKNELRATRDGTVAQVDVEVGQQVKFGDALVTFGPAQAQ